MPKNCRLYLARGGRISVNRSRRSNGREKKSEGLRHAFTRFCESSLRLCHRSGNYLATWGSTRSLLQDSTARFLIEHRPRKARTIEFTFAITAIAAVNVTVITIVSAVCTWPCACFKRGSREGRFEALPRRSWAAVRRLNLLLSSTKH